MYNLRLRQLMNQLSQQQPVAVTPSNSSDAHALPRFLSAYGDQASSYAAAVRRSPSRSPLSPWSDSRSSSPTASLSAKLSPLHLGSKGSSPSSTTSESTSERERPLSAGAVHDCRRHNYFGNAFNARVGGNSRDMWSHSRTGFTQNRTTRSSQQPGRPRSNSYSVASQNRTPPRLIPGIQLVAEQPSAETGEHKVNDGGWIKVERQKRLSRQDTKQVRGRGRRGGGRGGRGSGRIE